MAIHIPLENLDNSFDKQFMAMRYLLLGLMQKHPEYKGALDALESAAPYRDAHLKSPDAEPAYRENLLAAFHCYSKLNTMAEPARLMASLLTPDFANAPLIPTAATADDDEDIAAAPVPAAPGRVFSQFDKLFISMQYFLIGLIAHDAQYQVAYDAMLYAADIHVGYRKDGKTPSFQHQLEIAHLLRTMLRNMMFPAQTLAVAFLHDTPEDYDVSHATLTEKFGKMVADGAMRLNKYDEAGNPKSLDEYYADQANCPMCSLVKPGDNTQNQSTMSGVFGYKKQFEYSLNIRRRSWDMIKVARRRWPQQEAAYENIKFLLRIQYNATQAMLEAVQFDPDTGKVHPALQA